MTDYSIFPVGDTSLTVEFGNEISPEVNANVQALSRSLLSLPVKGVKEWIPTFRSLLIQYDPYYISYEELCKEIEKHISYSGGSVVLKARVFTIPVCYDEKFGEDMKIVSSHSGLSPKEIIKIHSKPEYLIYMLGFLPGFAYLGGLESCIFTPRLSSPRKAIPAGSVGIGGEQTGIYPVASPGGWNLIGRTPLLPYDPARKEAILYKAGDYIEFQPISEREFDVISNDIKNGKYQYDVHVREG